MTGQELIEYVNAHPGDYLEPDKHGGYICPLCGSGSRSHGTGMTTDDGKHWHCWNGGCYASGSVFDFLARAEV